MWQNFFYTISRGWTFKRPKRYKLTLMVFIVRLEDEVENCWQQRNVFLRFLSAAGHCIAAHTDVICYLLAIINHARCAGIISLPLPLLIFFWGSLTNPRPTERFWVIFSFRYSRLVGFLHICDFLLLLTFNQG